jgi:hypothetical protein
MGSNMLYPQLYYQRHGAAIAASRGNQRFPAAGSSFYAALLGEWHCEGSRRFHERLYHALLPAGSCRVVSPRSDFSKNVEAINSCFLRYGIIYYSNRAAASHLGLPIVFLQK